jgi:hypothetical protein
MAPLRAVEPEEKTPTLRLNLAMEEVAARIGVMVNNRKSFRAPIKHREDLEWWIRQQGLTGTLRIDFSQGSAGFVTWEESR